MTINVLTGSFLIFGVFLILYDGQNNNRVDKIRDWTMIKG